MHDCFVGFGAVGSGESLRFVTQRILFLLPRFFATALIDELSVCGGCNPGCGILRKSFFGPGSQRGRKSFLHGLLGPIEGPRNANQRGDNAAGFLSKQRFSNRLRIGSAHVFWTSSTGRISTAPAPPFNLVGILLP